MFFFPGGFTAVHLATDPCPDPRSNLLRTKSSGHRKKNSPLSPRLLYIHILSTAWFTTPFYHIVFAGGVRSRFGVFFRGACAKGGYELDSLNGLGVFGVPFFHSPLVFFSFRNGDLFFCISPRYQIANSSKNSGALFIITIIII